MPANIGIKAQVHDRPALEARVQTLAGDAVAVIEQDDCFFECAQGRLKLRDFGNGQGELIAYERPDQPGPATSSYTRTATADPAGLRDVLLRSLVTAGRVVKSRTLYIVGRTRIHIDQVDGLGAYMELEVVLEPGEAPAARLAEAQQLMAALEIHAADLCDGAYVDLLATSGPR